MRKTLRPDTLEKIKFELGELDRSFVRVKGKRFKPSQCYRFIAEPAHLLYNTNCPEDLKQKLQAILSKYIHIDEGSAQ